MKNSLTILLMLLTFMMGSVSTYLYDKRQTKEEVSEVDMLNKLIGPSHIYQQEQGDSIEGWHLQAYGKNGYCIVSRADTGTNMREYQMDINQRGIIIYSGERVVDSINWVDVPKLDSVFEIDNQ